MIAVIAEKPSVAREIARLLGAVEKKDGCLSGNGYRVTWAIGHLVGLGMPEDYGVSGFDRAALPVKPDPFLLIPRRVKKGKGFVADKVAQKQLKVIDQVFKGCERIIVATDTGREGELIFRYIYEYLKCQKPFERLWISSLTEKAIRQGFDNLKPGSAFDGLYAAARSRSRADWLVGINATQALSIAAGSGVYSLGRVQTPTLALVCNRYLANKAFKVQPYWQVQLSLSGFTCISDKRWDDKKEAECTLRLIGKNGDGVVVSSAATREVSEEPPLLYDLTGLQKEANKKLGFSAEETLSVAQSLYEKKFITYPRTGSRHIPEDMWDEIPALVLAQQEYEPCGQVATAMKYGPFNSRIVDDLRVTDHHGLITTDKIPSALPARENALYQMIAFRLLESLSKPCLKEMTDITLQAACYDFSAKGCRIVNPGWRAVRGSLFDGDSDTLQQLPGIEAGEKLQIQEAEVLEKKTKPKPLFTEATLLSAMQSAGREIENKPQRKALQSIGIGTPATRASIIETLLSRGYIVREKKSLVPTEKGLQVYGLVKDRQIADVAMSAEWELALQQIETGEAEAAVFQDKIESYAKTITGELLSTEIASESLPVLLCPKCGKQHLKIRDKIVKCPDKECAWIQFRTVCGVQITIDDVKSLVTRRKTRLLRGLKSKAGKTFSAFIRLNEKAESSFGFEDRKNYRHER